ncbi:MAG: hypothetical protein HOW97_19040, partial [Catenulispora sp.]|nr:hypothetical protein [Catenulispora sp.]
GGTRFRTVPGGRGAHGIAERTALLGGTATVGPTAATWRLHACLPLTPPHRAVHATPPPTMTPAPEGDA